METIIVTINTVEDSSSVEIRKGRLYTVKKQQWKRRARFPFKALLIGVIELIKQSVNSNPPRRSEQ